MDIDYTTYRSPNFNERAPDMKGAPYMIILHYTGRPSAEEAATDWLCNPEKEVSAHYLIDENGAVFNLVDEDKRAWHAGCSYWQGETDINSASIGIEIQNPGEEFGYSAFPNEQIASVIGLCKNITKRFEIKNILAHSDIAPGRKADPGALFPWAELAAHDLGVYPDPITVSDSFDRYKALIKLGYNPELPEDVLWEAFKLHYPDQPLERLAALVQAR